MKRLLCCRLTSSLVPCVSGFGPFREHDVNASWVAVQELNKLGLGEDIQLLVYEIPVEYQKVKELVPTIWKEHQPRIVVHVGVSGVANAVTLEQCGKNHGYMGLDNVCSAPGSHCCVEGGPACLDSTIDMENVRQTVQAAGLHVELSVSHDAGRYLCDYAYYTSLYFGKGMTAFIHVPPLGKPYTALELAQALQAIIWAMLEQLNSSA
uniref:Pyroglutamyl-peptidase I like n=1 Tax=Eptatretus burgeri TaxID=7764 RepID=A0A8C4X0U6_EPTBU